MRQGQRLTGMTAGQARFPVAPSIYKFQQHGEVGHLAQLKFCRTPRIADRLCRSPSGGKARQFCANRAAPRHDLGARRLCGRPRDPPSGTGGDFVTPPPRSEHKDPATVQQRYAAISSSQGAAPPQAHATARCWVSPICQQVVGAATMEVPVSMSFKTAPVLASKTRR